MNTITNYDNIPFTYYGDLLGISEYYKISENEGYNKLNSFYNTVYRNFRETDHNMKVFLFSDSLFITREKFETVLNSLGRLYNDLLEQDLLIKGAIVKGFLEFDPRLELKNWEKRLPTGNILFRAVGLEKQAQGIRLIIEKSLAQDILPEELYGFPTSYFRVFNSLNIGEDSILRKIMWSSDMNAYDYLWFNQDLTNIELLRHREIIQKLKEIKRHVNKKAQIHYSETIRLIKRFNP